MHFIETPRLSLRGLTEHDTEGPYFDWMNDAEITRFLESRYFPHTRASLNNFVAAMADGRNLLLGMFLKDEQKHIGNIKLGPINFLHRHASLGLLIGDKNEWGKGYACEAINAMTDYAFTQFNLNKVTAGIYSTNIGSIKTFEKAGFVKEGHFRNQLFSEGKWIDHLFVARFRDDAPTVRAIGNKE